MGSSWSDGFDHYPGVPQGDASFEKFGAGFTKKPDDESHQISWNQLAPMPTFWERVKQVFFPKRSPVTLVVGFHFCPDNPGGPAHWDFVEAECKAPGVVGKYRLEIKVWRNGQMIIEETPYAVMSNVKK